MKISTPNKAALALVLVTVVVVVGMLLGCAQPTPAAPQFPTKPITIIVPFKAGGGFDLQARFLAPALQKNLPGNVNVVISNVEGAGGRLGANQLAKSKPDGYTLGVLGLESVAFMRALGQIEDDPRQWTFLGQLSSDPLLVALNTAGPIKSVADMKTKDFRFGVTSEMLPSAAAITKAIGGKFRPVLFDGSGEAILSAMRGDIDAVVFSWPTMIKGVRDSQGKINSLFVVNKTRVEQVKDVPTLEELNVKPEAALYAVVSTSRVLVAPAGVDKGIRDLLVTAVDKAMSDPEFVANMKKGEYVIVTAKPDDLKKEMSEALDEFSKVVDLVKDFVK